MKKVSCLAMFCLVAGTMFAQYVDLGLPSGTLWKSTNEDGYFVALRAKNLYGDQLPSRNQIDELRQNCVWIWKETGFLVEGPSGNTIFLPAKGQRSCDGKMGYSGTGYYWTNEIGEQYSSRWAFYYSYGRSISDISGDSNCSGCCVRLVKRE